VHRRIYETSGFRELVPGRPPYARSVSVFSRPSRDGILHRGVGTRARPHTTPVAGALATRTLHARFPSATVWKRHSAAPRLVLLCPISLARLPATSPAILAAGARSTAGGLNVAVDRGSVSCSPVVDRCPADMRLTYNRSPRLLRHRISCRPLQTRLVDRNKHDRFVRPRRITDRQYRPGDGVLSAVRVREPTAPDLEFRATGYYGRELHSISVVVLGFGLEWKFWPRLTQD